MIGYKVERKYNKIRVKVYRKRKKSKLISYIIHYLMCIRKDDILYERNVINKNIRELNLNYIIKYVYMIT